MYRPSNIILSLISALIVQGAASHVFAQNPWQQRYEARSLTEEAPAVDETYRITYAQIKELIAQALEDKGAGDQLRTIIARRDEDSIITYREPLAIEVEQLTYDEVTKNWQAVLYFSAGNKTLAPVKISGRYEEIVETPVLKRRVTSGHVIQETDIAYRIFPTTRLKGETIMDASQLLGKSPKRTISALRPIRTDEIASPAVIHKGDTVNLFYKTTAMEIKTIGEALENGAEGDIIKIRNQDSHTIVSATIISKGAAQVVAAGAPAIPTSRE